MQLTESGATPKGYVGSPPTTATESTLTRAVLLSFFDNSNRARIVQDQLYAQLVEPACDRWLQSGTQVRWRVIKKADDLPR